MSSYWIVLSSVDPPYAPVPKSGATSLRLIEKELPSAALLDVNLGRELVTPVAEILLEHGVPLAVTSAYENPEVFGGDILAGAPNIGKPIAEHRVQDILERLMAS